MDIRTIYKYRVIKRFSLCKKMYDIGERIYIQEQDLEQAAPQKVFGHEKEYLTDISSEIYKSLGKGFVVKEEDASLNQNKSQ